MSSIQVANYQTGSSPTPDLRDDFLKNCLKCKKNLEGIDTYMYRGDAAFCSDECRDEEILADHLRMTERKTMKKSLEKSLISSNNKVIFFVGDVPLSAYKNGL
ncbi:unnamed protein product [Ilex paraguariensis]|uniref:FLZ-type domain-containing protein n=1 Tax=Ilex paraguariensis TaxID=185542 RepID=A0ABC8UX48_9AQUA